MDNGNALVPIGERCHRPVDLLVSLSNHEVAATEAGADDLVLRQAEDEVY
ncbi:hypothetical protein ACFSX5_05340 [Devosia albogilva]|uniref:Uncharacterized protein n=1 Tax=Devosia albogilva TaxID=429726 RepID=A0ABW5QHR8_9HYPH